MYRPQFAFPEPPAGFTWQPCIYQFDAVNVPALGNLDLAAGQVSGHIPLPLDRDACFCLLAVKIQDGGVDILLFDPWSNQLMDDFVDPRIYASELPPAAPLEGLSAGPGLMVPAGSRFSVRLQGR
ncbi:MAG TPA: hypothetical protein VN794_21805 [Methylomirabilota bacterium]|nr:hypothetical protein [Methylomirabilota bacterium]